ncbi:uncharacterized protein LOC128670053 isoform X1 [Plodia interpunctella]|uniref:uncharacterized protein LOC128670053 isoform X1 n=1 Tax=Plodia interpunctella TaxID=58824 RepID=UPI0023688FAF|nr:uncharacterized protein LOC128670053 isoform X1 [Plodia interpunctella]
MCFFGVFLFFLFLLVSATKDDMPGMDDEGILKSSDLETYIVALEKLVAFYTKYSSEIDVNTVFGFFMLKVNLISADKYKRKGVPDSINSRLKVIRQKSMKIVQYYHMMASQPQFNAMPYKQLKKKAYLYNEESLWLSQMKKPEKKLKKPPEVTPQSLVKRFGSYNDYIKQLGRRSSMVPQNNVTDRCINRLADNSIFHGQDGFPRCKLYPECVHGVAKGNNTGYGLVNRLWILLLAKFGRKCGVVNQREDKKIRDKLCASCYHEAWLISLYDFNPIMLLLDQITYCSINGNVEFLRKEWITYILALQTRFGCFSESITYDEMLIPPDFAPASLWKIDKGVMQDHPATGCYHPASSAAATILSAAVKFILEYTFKPK